MSDTKPYAKAFQSVFDAKGVDVLLNPMIFANCVSDMAGSEFEHENRVARRNLDARMLRLFYDAAGQGADEVKAAAKRVEGILEHEAALAPEFAHRISASIGRGLAQHVKNIQAYDQASRDYESGDYEKALKGFSILDGFKDAMQQAQDCEARIDLEKRYEAALSHFGNAVTELDYLEALSMFRQLGTYKDVMLLKRDCLELAQKAHDAEKVYKRAKKLSRVSDGNSVTYMQAANLFDSVSWYRDSEQKRDENLRLAGEYEDCERLSEVVDCSYSLDELDKAHGELVALQHVRGTRTLIERCERKIISERQYEGALRKIGHARHVEDFSAAAEALASLGSYRDAEQRRQSCLEEIERLRAMEEEKRNYDYAEALLQFDNAESIEQYDQAQKAFARLGAYRDAPDFVGKCNAMKARLQRKRDYVAAVELIECAETVAQCKKARSVFESLEGYLQSESYAQECDDKIADLEKAAEYERAKKLLDKAKEEDEYVKCAHLFDSLGDYQDAKIRAKQANAALAEIWLQREYDDAIDAIGDARDEDDFMALAQRFAEMGLFKEARDYEDVCRKKAEELRREGVRQCAIESIEYAKSATRWNVKYAKENIERAERLLSGIAGWNNTDELLRQCRKLKHRYYPRYRIARLVAALFIIFVAVLVVFYMPYS